ncbi:helix-turn-helix domain-containing protein [Flavobacterium jejuense]|nr:helix-turn-helix domain-containing protein [Flavobacterium jejuense]
MDTYISKLRIKLKADESVKLINIHGVGYKLEIN